jgi:hypothetical protein
MIRAVATVAAILVAAILVSVSVLYASSVAHRDAQTQDQILRASGPTHAPRPASPTADVASIRAD